jgi:hypothetical protein
MRKRWCHNHKTWTWDNWKCARDMVRWFVLHAVPYIRTSLHLENIQGSPQSGMPGSNSETQGGSVMVWAAILWYSILLIPLLLFMAELVQGSTWTEWVIRYIPWSRRYFGTTMQFSMTTMPPIHESATVHFFKTTKVNFNIFPGQHNHQIWTSLNYFGRFWWLQWGTDSHLQHLWNNLKIFFKQNGTKFCSKPAWVHFKKTAAVLKAKGGPTPY